MRAKRTISRRSFLATVAGSAVAGGSFLAVHHEARAVQASDCDPNDPVGGGRGRRPRTGVTDRDAGSNADSPGCGRGAANRPSGSGHSPGRGYSGYTDRDPTDRAGHGRGGSRSVNHTGVTDSDSGSQADPAGSGRGGSGSRSSYNQGNVAGRSCDWLRARQYELERISRVGVGSREASVELARELEAIRLALRNCG